MSMNLSSPFSTGGGGPDFERWVVAYYLAMALIKGVPRGLNGGATREIRVQRKFQGNALDDLIVVADLSSGAAQLSLQIKRDLTFGEENEVFNEVMEACWKTYKSEDFNFRVDRFGICVGLYSKKVDEYYQTVLTWARDSVSAEDFLLRVSQKHLAHETQRTFVTLIRSTLSKITRGPVIDEDLWKFLSSMVILRFDFHNEGSADYANTVELLKSILPVNRTNGGSKIFDRLVIYAGEGGRVAGSFDERSLRQRLLSEDFELLVPPDCGSDIERLKQHAALILNNIRSDINGLNLNRVSVLASAGTALSEHDFLELIGPPGSGKSAILKTLAQIQQEQGASLVLAGDRIEGLGWESFARDLQLSRSLTELLIAIGGSKPCLFIDGPDRLTDAGTRQVIKDILLTLKMNRTAQSGLGQLKVVVAVREENLDEFHSWFDFRSLGRAKVLQIPNLTGEEVHLVAEYFPRIGSLLSVERLRSILENPFMLNLIVDERILPVRETTMPPIATEIEVQNVWWERVVGSASSDGSTGTVAGRARQMGLLQSGQRAIVAPGRPLVLTDIGASVLVSLERDRIIVREPKRDVYRFAHDLFEDWILSRVLDQHRDDLPSYLKSLGEPFGLMRPVQLLGCAVLESNEPAEKWLNLISQLEKDDGISPRWRQALYSAPLMSTRAVELLNKIEDLLLDDGGKLLREMLIIARTAEVNPDVGLLSGLEDFVKAKSQFIPPVFYSLPIPRWNTWVPFVTWLVQHADQLPETLRPEVARLLEIWQQRAPKSAPFRKEIGEIAFSWLTGVERWHNRNA